MCQITISKTSSQIKEKCGMIISPLQSNFFMAGNKRYLSLYP